MDNNKYRSAIDAVIYIAGCVVNETVPDKARIEKVSLENLYSAAGKHMLTAITSYGLEKAGIIDGRFMQSYGKAIRKVTSMEIDKESIFSRMEKDGIWYVPLKGAVIKDMYPAIGLREVSDYDILFDAAYAERVKEIMLSLGFSCESFGNEHHDVYKKLPVSNFEMHTTLFPEWREKDIFKEFINIKDRLIKDEDNKFGYHFSDDDLYIYIISHEYSHFDDRGTGLRSLLDTYIILCRLGDKLDFDYIDKKMEKIGISDFEKKNRTIAMHLFSGSPLTADESEMLNYIIFSGTYGTQENSLANSVIKNGGGSAGKRRFILKKIFISMSEIKAWYPFFYKYKILIPLLPAYIIIEAFTVNRKETLEKLKALKKIK